MDGFKAREEVSGVQAVRSTLLTSTTDELSSTPSMAAETSPPGSMSMEWTDEKHSLYLKSMETSFVNELYDSMELLGWCNQNKDLSHSKSSRPSRLKTFASPAQFKVLRSGCWQKIHFDRAESSPVKTDDTNSSALLSNPWILHFKSARKTPGGVEDRCATEHVPSVSRGNDHSDGNKAMSRWGSSSSKHFRFGGRSSFFRQDSRGTNTEVSDQNFVDEDNDGEKAKRVKTQEGDSLPSASDQVVPLRKP